MGSRLRLILFYSGGGLTLDGLVALALYLIRLHLHSDLLSMWVMVVWVTVPYRIEWGQTGVPTKDFQRPWSCGHTVNSQYWKKVICQPPIKISLATMGTLVLPLGFLRSGTTSTQSVS